MNRPVRYPDARVESGMDVPPPTRARLIRESRVAITYGLALIEQAREVIDCMSEVIRETHQTLIEIECRRGPFSRIVGDVADTRPDAT